MRTLPGAVALAAWSARAVTHGSPSRDTAGSGVDHVRKLQTSSVLLESASTSRMSWRRHQRSISCSSSCVCYLSTCCAGSSTRGASAALLSSSSTKSLRTMRRGPSTKELVAERHLVAAVATLRNQRHATSRGRRCGCRAIRCACSCAVAGVAGAYCSGCARAHHIACG